MVVDQGPGNSQVPPRCLQLSIGNQGRLLIHPEAAATTTGSQRIRGQRPQAPRAGEYGLSGAAQSGQVEVVGSGQKGRKPAHLGGPSLEAQVETLSLVA